MTTIFERLAAPFPAEDIEWKAGATTQDKDKALAMAYITSRAVMDRLDEVVGPENWQDQYTQGPSGGVLCGISVKVDGEWVTKWDGAENSDFEAVKGGLSDAFKRAGYKWGIGRYLYKVDSQWVPCEIRGKSVVLKGTPKLPAWALPQGDKKGQPQLDPAVAAAMEVRGSKGERYGDLDDDGIAYRLNALKKTIETKQGKNGPVTDAEFELAVQKYDALKLLKEHRAKAGG